MIPIVKEYLIKVRPGVNYNLYRLTDLLQFVGFDDEENMYAKITSLTPITHLGAATSTTHICRARLPCWTAFGMT